jgi:zinc finger protein ubi-d4
MTEQYYREALENVASYNSRLCSERRQRLPFLDSQTGVAQNHSNLWIPYRYRGPGRSHGQIYSYPAQRWRKKCSLPLPDIPLPRIKPTDVDISEPDVHVISTVENTLSTSVDSDSKDIDDQTIASTVVSTSTGQTVYREDYYNDWENLSEPPDAGEIDQRNSDSSDFEETYIRRKGRRKDRKKSGPAMSGTAGNSSSSSRSRKKDRDVELAVERDKPHACESSSSKRSLSMTSALSAATASSALAAAAVVSVLPKVTASVNNTTTSKYCDFCLGNETENKKTGSREEMVSCADCGRCGHPSCLQFTPNMIISVKKYPWQCIECKSCGICGTSDNDDQLLFCDDCDRGYHMYCLSPPLSEPPEGSWSCHLCIEEFYGGQKSEAFIATSKAPDT